MDQLLNKQKQFLQNGETINYQFRAQQLKKLKKSVQNHEKEIFDALYSDLGKSNYESFLSEVGFLYREIDHTLKHLKKWMKMKSVSGCLLTFPSKGYLSPMPLGVTLIIAPWNYPFLLMLSPLVGAIAAGCTSILRPSELSPATSAVIAKILKDFPRDYIEVVEGGVTETQELLKLPFDKIFFTGSTQVGKIVMEAASKNLTPVTLELGGKSPCVFWNPNKFEKAVKRIIWGKFLNCGQTCVAPDYILIRKEDKKRFVEEAQKIIKQHFGKNPLKSKDYGKIISVKHYERLKSLLEDSLCVFGGEFDDETQKISPTLLTCSGREKVMEEEIFGPILPIIEVQNYEEIIKFINNRPRPLALYSFSSDFELNKLIRERTWSGGLLYDDTVLHLSHPQLPFGGVGHSGQGAYHGKYSFDAFTHYRPILKRSYKFENNLRFPPFWGKLPMLRKLLKWL
ncbi:MAG: aldehyde dehydrogenase family protein [Halobacteriovoraceae bacterium]|nr:aldehyde dehydrogenase family protein [Halobacteriovoraceae bacterium]